MTATCREACCSVVQRLSVSELFERGFRRLRETACAIEGDARSDTEGNVARFSIDFADGRIQRVGFRSSSCATLVAYCELIAETVPTFSREIADGLTATQIINALPGVPPYKQQRAALAVAAFRDALSLIPDQPRDPYHESGLHLRNPAP
jgi:NifU-like protein involved in Fe-S cluster formation